MTKRVDYETFADIVENPGFRLPVLQKLRERKRVSEGCLNEIKSNFREVDYGEYVIQQSKARIFDFNEFVNVVPFAFWRDVCSRILENQIDDLSQVINSMEDLFKKINGYADNLKKGKKEEVGFDSFCKVFPEPATHLFAYKELRESGVDEEILSQVKRELFKKEEEDKTKR
ncbi:MAG: hypothetical protein LBF42_02955 [Puniceicoccales bacterium]|jgi:hypothetical protein|nr:hypothetical protein [Puniceicoccales bacterium]